MKLIGYCVQSRWLILLIVTSFYASHAVPTQFIQRYLTSNAQLPHNISEQYAQRCLSKKNEWQGIKNDLLCTSYRNIGLIFCITAPLAAIEIALSIPLDITPDPSATCLCAGAVGFTTLLHTPLLAGAGCAHVLSKWYEAKLKKLDN